MAAPLSSIFAAVDAQITANLAGAGISPSYGTSGVDRQFESAPPRIVWVPTDEEIQPTKGQGGDVTVDSAGNQILPSGSMPPILLRLCTVECDLWAADRDTVDGTMINAVFSAVHDVCSLGSYGVLRARWMLPEEISKEGECYRIWFQFLIPITRVEPAETTATIISIPQTPAIDPILS